MIYKDILFYIIPNTAHSCIVEKELAVKESAREWIGWSAVVVLPPNIQPPNLSRRHTKSDTPLPSVSPYVFVLNLHAIQVLVVSVASR